MTDVEWQNERGTCILAGPPIRVDFCEHAPPNSVCLRFIDPYGDTTFNAAQIEVLENELAEMVRATKNAEVAEEAKSLLNFVAKVPVRVHMYLKFIGD